jgi:putative ABC transport system substrate-binding protein
MRSIESAAASLNVRAIAVPLRVTADIEPAIKSFASEPDGGLILPTDTFTQGQRPIVELANGHRLPATSWDPEFPKDGGLMCYSVTVTTLDHYRQAAGYVDRILKGTKPGDLPVQLGTKYTLVINLKTAKALGLTVPSSLLATADEVIE